MIGTDDHSDVECFASHRPQCLHGVLSAAIGLQADDTRIGCRYGRTDGTWKALPDGAAGVGHNTVSRGAMGALQVRSAQCRTLERDDCPLDNSAHELVRQAFRREIVWIVRRDADSLRGSS